jgi:hypothetical protein
MEKSADSALFFAVAIKALRCFEVSSALLEGDSSTALT